MTAENFQTNIDTIEDVEDIDGVYFIAKVNPQGSGIVYATYLGAAVAGSLTGQSAIAVDPSGAAYIAGQTDGIHFPTTSDALYTSNPLAASASVAGIPPAAGYFWILSPGRFQPCLFHILAAGNCGSRGRQWVRLPDGWAHVGRRFPTSPLAESRSASHNRSV